MFPYHQRTILGGTAPSSFVTTDAQPPAHGLNTVPRAIACDLQTSTWVQKSQGREEVTISTTSQGQATPSYLSVGPCWGLAMSTSFYTGLGQAYFPCGATMGPACPHLPSAQPDDSPCIRSATRWGTWAGFSLQTDRVLLIWPIRPKVGHHCFITIQYLSALPVLA